jgi:hypothetical protein
VVSEREAASAIAHMITHAGGMQYSTAHCSEAKRGTCMHWTAKSQRYIRRHAIQPSGGAPPLRGDHVVQFVHKVTVFKLVRAE